MCSREYAPWRHWATARSLWFVEVVGEVRDSMSYGAKVETRRDWACRGNNLGLLTQLDLGGSLTRDKAMIPGPPCHGGCRGLRGEIDPGRWVGDSARVLGGQVCTESMEGPAIYRVPLVH